MAVHEFTVAEGETKRQPWESIESWCPACNVYSDARGVEYRTVPATRGHNSERLDLTSLDQQRDPHLAITCSICGYWWEAEVRSP